MVMYASVYIQVPPVTSTMHPCLCCFSLIQQTLICYLAIAIGPQDKLLRNAEVVTSFAHA